MKAVQEIQRIVQVKRHEAGERQGHDDVLQELIIINDAALVVYLKTAAEHGNGLQVRNPFSELMEHPRLKVVWRPELITHDLGHVDDVIALAGHVQRRIKIVGDDVGRIILLDGPPEHVAPGDQARGGYAAFKGPYLVIGYPERHLHAGD